ncbi:hypothetical protein MCL32_12210 [Acinetobacter pittii]|uniref:hypothetical protein n=1 Tax=Acinetobacter pittii TaxID=48296 RepID=UPI001EFEC7DE|nr:hypothetical protein [Acinetobacter pittii]MCG9512375.1 hypothetical protein [Acinetobacter pittii]
MEYSTQDALEWLNQGIEDIRNSSKDDRVSDYALGYDIGFLYGTLRTLLATGHITCQEYNKFHAELTETRQARQDGTE